jgi:hypothetical protein
MIYDIIYNIIMFIKNFILEIFMINLCICLEINILDIIKQKIIIIY